jgi:hypothetical protein
VKIAEAVAGEASSEESGMSTPSSPSIIIERRTAGIEVELIGGRRVRFDRDVDPETMKRLIAALEAGAS